MQITTKHTKINVSEDDSVVCYSVKGKFTSMNVYKDGQKICITDQIAIKQYQQKLHKNYIVECAVTQKPEKLKIKKHEVVWLKGIDNGEELYGVTIVKLTSNKGISYSVSVAARIDAPDFDRNVGIDIAFPYAFSALKRQTSHGDWKREKGNLYEATTLINKGLISEYTKKVMRRAYNDLKSCPMVYVCGCSELLNYSRGVFGKDDYFESLVHRGRDEGDYWKFQFKKGRYVDITW